MRSQRFRTRPSAALAPGTALLAFPRSPRNLPPRPSPSPAASRASWAAGRLDARLRDHAPSYDAADDVGSSPSACPRGPSVQGRPQRQLGRELRAGRGSQRLTSRSPAGGRSSSITTTRATGSPTTSARSSPPCPAASRASWAAPATGCPTVCAPGSGPRRRWPLHVHHDGDPGRQLRSQGRHRSWAENYGRDGIRDGANIPFTVPADGAEIFFQYDAASHLLTILDGAPKGDLRRARAHWVSQDTIAWNSGGAADVFALHADAAGGLAIAPGGVQGGTRIPLTRDPSGLPADMRAKFPHLASYAALKVDPSRLSEVPALLKGQLAVSRWDRTEDRGRDLAADPGVLDDLFT